MSGSVVLFQLHYGHSSITLNQLSHFFNQRNSGNFLTALRTSLYQQQGVYLTPLTLTQCLPDFRITSTVFT